MGGSALVAFDGHKVMAKAVAKARVPFVLSANSVIPLEEIARANPGTWFNPYPSPNREAMEGMVQRAARAGISVLALTTDVPVGSNREAEAHNGFGFPIRPNLRLTWDLATHPRWSLGVLGRTFLRDGIPHIVNLKPNGGPNLFSTKVKQIAVHEELSWDHARLMRSLWKGPFVPKGLLSPADVAMARDARVDGVILSNHGVRRLDHAAATMRVLKSAVEAARGMPVMIDSDFRRGTDVLLALGASMVFIGRPFLFAAAYAGEPGVQHAISLLAKEIHKDMALLGLRSIEDINEKIIVSVPTSGHQNDQAA